MADSFSQVGGRLVGGELPANGDVLTWDAALGVYRPMPVPIVPPPPVGGIYTWFDVMLARAQVLTGLLPINAGKLWDDFTSLSQWQLDIAVPGGVAPYCNADWSCGVADLAVNGGGDAGCNLQPANGIPVGGFYPGGVAYLGFPSWYMASVMQMTAPPGNPAGFPYPWAGMQMAQSHVSELRIGLGSFSQPGGRFSLSVKGNNGYLEVPSTVAYESQNWHLFEMWRTAAGVLTFRVDDEAPIAVDDSSVTPFNDDPGTVMVGVRNDGVNGAELLIDKLVSMFPSPPILTPPP